MRSPAVFGGRSLIVQMSGTVQRTRLLCGEGPAIPVQAVLALFVCNRHADAENTP